MKNISLYFSLVKFSHSLFALPFALTGFFMAIGHYNYSFKPELLAYVLLCMVFARNAAMSFNRWTDKHWDKHNIRTANREIPSGKISAKNALIFVCINSILFIGTTYFINNLCFYLSPIALLIILGYSYTKRYTFLCHFILGIGLGLAPVGAFLAVSGKFELLPILLGFSVWAWVSGFDILYALQDIDFDKQNNLYSVPAKFGLKHSLWIARGMHCISGFLMYQVIVMSGFSLQLFVALTLFCLLLMYQHSLIKSTDLSRINFAFFNLNGIASILFATFAIWGYVF